MIFFCFSSKDRYTVVESFLYHIKNFGFKVWYDRHDIILGDNRNYVNFVEGIEMNSYSVIILTENTMNSICANEEIDLIKAKYNKGEMTVFPIYYNLKASELPQKYQWMNNLVYKELTPSTGSLGACNHIFTKILKDKIVGPHYNILDFTNYYSKLEKKDPFISKMLESYLLIDSNNFNSRISIMYSLYSYIELNHDVQLHSLYFKKGFERIFNLSKLSIDIDLRELLYCEYLLLIILNVILDNT